MKCDKCKSEIEPDMRVYGAETVLYYGKTIAVEGRGAGIVETRLRIEGNKRYFMCSNCIIEIYSSWGVYFGPLIVLIIPGILAGLIFDLGISTDNNVPFIPRISIILPLLVLCAGSVWAVIERNRCKRAKMGDKDALNALKKKMEDGTVDSFAMTLLVPDLKKAGYDQFFSPKEYNALLEKNK